MLLKAGVRELNRRVDTQQKGFVFAGFNAISECERELFRYFKRERKGEFYWIIVAVH